MFASYEIAKLVHDRRVEMGLSQAATARLCGLSRATVNQIENQSIKDLSLTRLAKLFEALGLWLSFAPSKNQVLVQSNSMTALQRAAQSAGVSYKTPLPVGVLKSALKTATVQEEYAHLVHAVMEDAAVSLLVAVVEEISDRDGVSRAMLWSNMRTLAGELGVRRSLWA